MLFGAWILWRIKAYSQWSSNWFWLVFLWVTWGLRYCLQWLERGPSPQWSVFPAGNLCWLDHQSAGRPWSGEVRLRPTWWISSCLEGWEHIYVCVLRGGGGFCSAGIAFWLIGWGSFFFGWLAEGGVSLLGWSRPGLEALLVTFHVTLVGCCFHFTEQGCGGAHLNPSTRGRQTDLYEFEVLLNRKF